MSNSTSNNPRRKRKSVETTSDSMDESTSPPASERTEHPPMDVPADANQLLQDGIEATLTCPRCQHAVPLSNRIVHEANCSRRSPVSRPEAASAPPSDADLHAAISTRANSQVQNPSAENAPAASFVMGSIRPPPQSRLDRNNDHSRTEPDTRQPYSLSYHDVPAAATMDNVSTSTPSNETPTTSTTTTTAAAPTTTTANNEGTAEWACPRCTLLNPPALPYCDACLYRRSPPVNATRRELHPLIVRPPDPMRRERLVGDGVVQDGSAHGWVNVSPAPLAGTPHANTNNPNNGTTHGVPSPQQRLTTGYRIFNSALNGAMIGSVFGGLGGMLVGGIAGGLGGAYVSRVRNREEVEGRREVEEVLRNVDGWNGAGEGNIAGGTVRVHRGRNHLIAVSTDGIGGNRILRLRYNGMGRRTDASSAAAAANNTNQQQENAEIMERALAEMLLRMSYMHGFVPARGYGNILIQPELSYEELLERYGLGNENRRGASEGVIDSYPVAVVGEDDDQESVGSKLKHDQKEEDLSSSTTKTTGNVDYGTCGICLEDYQKGEQKKTLACPHSFHKECIDRWLKQVASCPVCKKEVEMFQPNHQVQEDKKPESCGGK
ncbi:hypothetical protein HJC23_013415 [Cyclotella cryptica]|uniref:RING-type E3 ubiquitin transferase n=1 Tax=Cyclotella cryptica TaxID=29204 RepID=A0ABD3P5C0_9STRA|eukprot:CCRYP_017251-RA/>CCRYP_017251-RA protein AED:0.00 eAED:0.00 QI:171/-1/1/1/-1/1/1/341/605